MPQISYQLLFLTRLSYMIPKIPINLSLSSYPKATTPPAQYLQLSSEICYEKYNNHQKIFTDGSKSSFGVGSGCFSTSSSNKASLPSLTSIYFAEMYAIQLALIHIRESPHTSFVIFSDSCSSLLSLQNQLIQHSLVRKIIHQIDELNTNGKLVEMCWVPSHVGIWGNSEADRFACNVVRCNELIPIYYQDIYYTPPPTFLLSGYVLHPTSYLLS